MRRTRGKGRCVFKRRRVAEERKGLQKFLFIFFIITQRELEVRNNKKRETFKMLGQLLGLYRNLSKKFIVFLLEGHMRKDNVIDAE